MQSSSITTARRRQNTSCDACRRSKRRCAPSTNEQHKTGQACNNCVNLGYICTFKFVTSRTAQAPQAKMAAVSTDTESTPSWRNIRFEPVNELQDATSTYNHLFAASNELDTSTRSPIQDESFDLETFFADFDAGVLGIRDASKSVDSADFAHEPTARRENTSVLPMQQSHPFVIGSLSSSPIQLLNSSLNANILNHRLSAIYETMMTGIASRFLDYACNGFAIGHRYCFEDNDCLSLLPSTPCSTGSEGSALIRNPVAMAKKTAATTPDWVELSPSARTVNVNARLVLQHSASKVTLLGVARFLDNFAVLYDNKLDSGARQQVDAVFTAVLYAFSLQWLPSSCVNKYRASADPHSNTRISSPGSPILPGPSRDVFVDAWFRAHSQLVQARSHRSFVYIYASFLFNMTVIPPEASSEDCTSALETLNCSLRQLIQLCSLVKEYCKCLSHDSVYAALMQSSINIFQWFGYVRDTVASITCDRQCVMPYKQPSTKG